MTVHPSSSIDMSSCLACHTQRREEINEKGITVVETLAGLLLLTVFSIAIMKSTNLGINVRGQTTKLSIATALASSTLEELSIVDPSTLKKEDSYEDSVIKDKSTYSRSVSITVQPNGTRVIKVNVRGHQGSNVNLETSLSLWDFQ